MSALEPVLLPLQPIVEFYEAFTQYRVESGGVQWRCRPPHKSLTLHSRKVKGEEMRMRKLGEMVTRWQD